MDAVQALERLGGVATLRALRKLTTRARIRQAVRRGAVIRDGRGRYALPTAQEGLRAANRLTGVMSHLSAAAYWAWELKHQPAQPSVTVPRNRNVPPERREGVDVTWADLAPDEIRDGLVTSPDRTVIDCIRSLPFDEALAVADSALRHRHLTKARLIYLAGQVTGKGARQARRVAAHASEKAANPFESVLRAIAIEVQGLDLEPQVWLELDSVRMRPDLLDRRRRLIVEAESFEFHGKRVALTNDCIRYNAFALAGYVVLRFSWEQVMLHPEYVARCLRQFVADRRPRRRSTASTPTRRSA